MALWSLDIEKHYQGEYWTNRYILDAASLAAASAAGLNIVAIEQAVHTTDVEFTKYRVSDLVPLTDNYVVQPINSFGLVAINSGYLPLFNVARIDLTPGTGRPSRKYLRCPLQESQVVNFDLEGTYRSFLATNYVNPLIAVPEYCDVDGQTIIGGSVYPRVGMRQLRRGTKRKLQPILP